jgi:hypothetical protein
MRVLWRVALSLAVAACAPADRVAPTVTVAAAPARDAPLQPEEDERAALVKKMKEAQQAYVERGEVKTFFSMLAPDLEVEAARSSTKSPYDAVFARARLEAIYLWAARHQPKAKVRVADAAVGLRGDTATLSWRTYQTSEGRETSAFGERYDLAKRGGEWKIVRFRYWPLLPDSGKEFGHDYFAELDRKIEQEQQTGDDRNAARDLVLAYRFDESAALSRRLTAQTPEEPWVWEIRGLTSALIGDIDDAERSMQAVRRLKGEGDR